MDIVCILDRSGSMESRGAETVSGFNGFLEEQKVSSPKAKLTLALFDHEYLLVEQATPIRRVAPLVLGETYVPRGMTSLLDAVGRTISDGELSKKKKVLVLIMTDGFENNSREYTNESVRSLVEDRKAKGWEFVYIGAEVDVFAQAQSIGVTASFTVSADAGPLGNVGAMGAQGAQGIMSNAMYSYTSGHSLDGIERTLGYVTRSGGKTTKAKSAQP